MTNAQITRTTLTAKEAAEFLGISYWLITQLVKRRKIPCCRVGGRLLFRVQSLQDYLDRCEKESVESVQETFPGYGRLRKVEV